MNTTKSDGALARRAQHAARPASEGVAPNQVPTSGELALLESAHDQLLRQVQDLKRVYAAERERRARLARSTMDLVTVLARSGPLPTFGPFTSPSSEASRGA